MAEAADHSGRMIGEDSLLGLARGDGPERPHRQIVVVSCSQDPDGKIR
jgi:hypothetical protein